MADKNVVIDWLEKTLKNADSFIVNGERLSDPACGKTSLKFGITFLRKELSRLSKSLD